MRKFMPKTVLVLFMCLFYALLHLPAYAIGLSAFDTEAEISIDEDMEASTNLAELEAISAEEDKTSYKQMEELPFLEDEEEYDDSDKLPLLETDLDDEAYEGEEAGITNIREATSKAKTTIMTRRPRPWRRSATFSATYKRDSTSIIARANKLVMFYRGKEYPLDRNRIKVLAHSMNRNPFVPFSTMLTVRLQLFTDKTGTYVRPNIIDKVYLNTGKPSWNYTTTFPVKNEEYITSSEIPYKNEFYDGGIYGTTAALMDTKGGRYLLGDGGLYRFNAKIHYDATKVTLPILDDGDVMGEYVLPNAYERYYLHGKKYGERQMNECKYMASFKSNHYSRASQIRNARARDEVIIGGKTYRLETGLYKVKEINPGLIRIKKRYIEDQLYTNDELRDKPEISKGETPERQAKPIVRTQETLSSNRIIGGRPRHIAGKVELPIYEDKGDPRGEYVIPNMQEKVYIHEQAEEEEEQNWKRTAVFHYLYPRPNANEPILSIKQEVVFDNKVPHRKLPKYARYEMVPMTGLIAGYVEFPIHDDGDGKGEYVIPNYNERLYLDQVEKLKTMTWNYTASYDAVVLLDTELIEKAGTPIFLQKDKERYRLEKGRYQPLELRERPDFPYIEARTKDSSTDTASPNEAFGSRKFETPLESLDIPEGSYVKIKVKLPVYDINGEFVVPNSQERIYLHKKIYKRR